MDALSRFERYCARKTRQALRAEMPGYDTVCELRCSDDGRVAIGNDWTRRLFDGEFYVSAYLESRHERGLTPVQTSLVFVQSREGNTEAANPADLGGGQTDTHLIYEGLSRVTADAVMAGATTAREDDLVFSVWHPELVRLREACGLPRHPIQIVVTNRADLPLETALLYTVPTLRTFVVTGTRGAERLRSRIADRPWIDVIDAGQPLSLAQGVSALAERGIRSISAVGGRATAAALIEAGLVSDLYLTTSPTSAGTPNTPLYDGPLNLDLILEKRGRGRESGVRFEHFAVRVAGPAI